MKVRNVNEKWKNDGDGVKKLSIMHSELSIILYLCTVF